MEKYSAKELLEKYKQGKCSEEEIALVEAWYASWDGDGAAQLEDQHLDAAVDRVFARLPVAEPKVKRFSWMQFSAAASLFLLISLGLLIFFKKEKRSLQTTQNIYQDDVAPGGNKAVLILASGKRISLTDAIYEVNETDGHADPSVYNTIETPRGGQYQVRLPDGTQVWLNSASSLKYPASFKTLKQRRVELSGEAYFEVAKNKTVPFRVVTGHQEVEVLGTHFNINGYAEEGAVKTTLLEGSVKVHTNSGGMAGPAETLKPGEQSTFSQNEIKVAQADIETIMAWKNGDFIFKNEDFKTAMRKVARWYDVDVVYELKTPVDIQPGGWISRKNNISSVLEMIESTGKVHFKIKGRSVIVENK